MRRLRPACLLLLLAPLAACEGFTLDPFQREGRWRPNGTNEHNLVAMVEEPRDLLAGRAAEGADGQRAAQAVERLRLDRVRPLPASSISRITAGGGQPVAGQGAAAAPGF